MDHVEKILQQWAKERPDLDLFPMGVLGRLSRLHAHAWQAIDKNLAQHGLSSASFDILATLRRSGEPYRLSPGALLETSMITSGSMTNRIDQLEKRDLARRMPNPQDGRGFLVCLTPKGLALVDEAVTTHLATEQKLLGGLSGDERLVLNGLLKAWLTSFEQREDKN
jgi:DNA-binding MarR family transcriptional regulator